MEVSVIKRTWVVGAATLGALALVVALVTWCLLKEGCANELLNTYRSPNGAFKVVVFARNCGATSGFSTQAAVLDGDQDWGNESGNLWIADGNHGAAPSGPGGGPEVRVRWLSGQVLELSHHPKARIFKAEADWGGVHIVYNAF